VKPDPVKALNMLNAFAGVGVQVFDVTFTNLVGEKTGFRAGRSIDALRQIITPLLQDTTAKQHNVIIRPRKPNRGELVQLDDLNHQAAQRIQPLAFMVLCTSPGNYQAWVAVTDAPADFARRLRKGTGADPSASGATRISGSLNFKSKYVPAFPLIEITHVNPSLMVSASELEGRGLVAVLEPAPARVSQPRRAGKGRRWPSYALCVQHAPPVHQGDRPDVSRADFTWCMTALDWGWSIEDTAARLLEQSSKARENGEGYAVLTTQNAAAAIARRTQPVKSPPHP
jgi:hypothetical protein